MKKQAESIDEIKSRLRRDLIPPSDPLTFANIISAFLENLPRKPTRQNLTRVLADHLGRHPIFLGQRQFVARLIDNRPCELEAVVDQSGFDEMLNLGKWLIKSGWNRSTTSKALSKEQRSARQKLAKRRHEYARAARRKTGLIEEQFGGQPEGGQPGKTYALGSIAAVLLQAPSQPRFGPCLDELLSGGEVRMSTESNSLQRIFGIGRKSLPRHLPNRRSGRAILYDYRALLACMYSLLKSDRWLEDPERRRTVLSNVIERAKYIAAPDIAAAFEDTLARFLA